MCTKTKSDTKQKSLRLWSGGNISCQTLEHFRGTQPELAVQGRVSGQVRARNVFSTTSWAGSTTSGTCIGTSFCESFCETSFSWINFFFIWAVKYNRDVFFTMQYDVRTVNRDVFLWVFLCDVFFLNNFFFLFEW